MDSEVSGWELAYRDGYRLSLGASHEDVESLHERFQQNGVRRILDLGCGDGRHLMYFGRLGYRMCGLDYAPTALQLAEDELARESLDVELICSDMTTIPWPDESFDAVVCVDAIQHNLVEGIRRTINEMHRVLKSGGWLFITVGTCQPIGPIIFRNGFEIEPGTYVLTEGREKGVPHHFFSTTELLDEFSHFVLVDFHWDSHSRACLLLRKEL